jgi:Calcineurin-like phosphoesterase
MAGKRFTVAVASDLHAYAKLPENHQRPSHLSISTGEQQPENHPIAGLVELIKRDEVSANVLLCPGDLAHQACPECIRYGWTTLQQIQEALKAKHLLGTAGNHDLDSRYLHGNPDAAQTLKNLSPQFPCAKAPLANQYWARDYTIVELPPAVIVILNSSAHHGHGENEKNHGRITKDVLSSLRAGMPALATFPIKILLCHHHPHQHSELNLGAIDVMENGQQLLDLLAADSSGTWLVIHGHKHHPKISYAAGGGNSPIVFASGSLCSDLFLELQTAARNQFHIITFDLDAMQRLGLVGRIRSWYWQYGMGWAPAKRGTGLPMECGFGFRGRPGVMAEEIRSIVKKELRSWNAVTASLETLHYMLPQDFDYMRALLNQQHRIKIVEDDNGYPVEVGEVV